VKKKLLFLWLYVWGYIPFGNLCQFWFGNLRVTLQKDLWVRTDTGKGTVGDLLPITLVSEKLCKRIEEELIMKGYEVNL
jgi:hypothetical protein